MYERKDYARFYFKSSCEHPIYMNYIYVSTESGKQEIKRKELNKDFIRSYGVAQYDLYIGDVNQDIVGWGGYGYSLNPPKKFLLLVIQQQTVIIGITTNQKMMDLTGLDCWLLFSSWRNCNDD